jgi:predicted ABC-type transport system involved in lysophospholipase L1 biosynthesis ATPase subunit
VLLVTHAREAAAQADRVLRLEAGRLSGPEEGKAS